MILIEKGLSLVCCSVTSQDFGAQGCTYSKYLQLAFDTNTQYNQTNISKVINIPNVPRPYESLEKYSLFAVL